MSRFYDREVCHLYQLIWQRDVSNMHHQYKLQTEGGQALILENSRQTAVCDDSPLTTTDIL